jgi:fibrillarin-like rRNA methylase
VKEISERVRIEGRSLWSRNAVKGVSLRGERLKRDGRKEWRQWSPRTSKLGAGILRANTNVSDLLPSVGTTCLYLGAGHGTTISHLHDHVCGSKNHLNGSILAVDLSSRCIRDLIRMADVRPGLMPVLADARAQNALTPFLSSKVSWIFQDVSQTGQVEMFIKSCKQFLAPGGTAILSLKAASERRIEGGDIAQFDHAETSLLSAGHELIERINLAGWENQHVLFHTKVN